jgi:ribosomal RNA methyltransferase Nop2
MQKEQEDLDAEAELQDLQTNIAERPKILDDEDDQGRPITNLVTQDITLLRNRLNDTVRVLDDFANLAEPGRSRMEYRDSLLKDICSYYGYSEFLADKLLALCKQRRLPFWTFHGIYCMTKDSRLVNEHMLISLISPPA